MIHSRSLVLYAMALLASAGCKKKEAAPAGDGSGSAPAAGSATASLKTGVRASLGGGKPGEGFAPSKQGFKFQNYGGDAKFENLTPVEVKRLFGADVCADADDKGNCILTPAGERWMQENNKAMDGGHCEGMATLALLFDLKKANPADFGASTAFELAIEGNAKLQHEIAYWFSTQSIAPMSKAEVRTLTPNEIADKLAEGFKTGAESYTIGIYMLDGSGGHATTPYAIVDKSDTETWIMHYDNNFPGEERHIDIDRKANTWKYFTAADPKEPGSVYEGNADSKSLTIAPTSVRTGTLICPFCGEIDDAKDDETRAKGSRRIMLDGDAHLLITDDTGKKIGYDGGKLVNEIPGAQAIEPKAMARRADSEPVYDLPSGHKLVVTLDGSALKKKDASDVSLIANGYTMGVYGVDLEPGEKDTIEFSADWKEISYTTQLADTPDLELGVATLGADYKFEIHASGEEGGQRVDISLDAKAGTLGVSAAAKDGAATYEVIVHRIADHGEQVFKHAGVAAGAKDKFVFHYADWQGNGKGMKVGVDKGGDGTIDEVEDLTDEE